MDGDNVDDARLAALVGHLYDAALDHSLWPGMASRIAAAFDSTSAVVKLHGVDDSVGLIDVTANLVVPERHREWAEEWHRRDLWVERSLAYGLSQVVTDDMLVSDEDRRHSGFYSEWLAELDIHHMIGAVFPADDGGVGVLGVHRPRRARAYGEAERRRVASLLPHLGRALRLRRHVAAAAVAEAAALTALERVDAGVLLLTRDCRIVHANRVAEAILRRESGVLTTENHRLSVRQSRLANRLAALVRGAADTALGRSAATPQLLAVRRAGRRPLVLDVMPMTMRVAGAGALAMVFVRDPDPPLLAVEDVRKRFGMTRAEARIAADLASGLGVPEIARKRGITVGTARWHLKRVLAKTGTTRQAEAVAVLIGSGALALQTDS